MSEPVMDPRFEYSVKQTHIVRPPRQNLATFGVTKVHYYVVTEPVYTDLNPAKGHPEAVVRDGIVTAERPRVVTPQYLLNTEGFGTEAREFLTHLQREYGPYSPGLLYGYKNEPEGTEIVSGDADEVANRIAARLDEEEKVLDAVIKGVDELWDVSLMKFIFELTNNSVRSNVADLQSSGLLETKQGIPNDARRRIDWMLDEARKGSVDPSDIHKELERWDLFGEYQDRFFELFKRR